jgi:hypothetical protein
MKSSCISHKPNDPLIIVRESYIDICGGNRNAAIVLSYFEYWHNIKIGMVKKNQTLNNIAEKHGDQPDHDTTLFQWHTRQEIYDSCFGMVAINKIKEACSLLESKGFLSLHRNPNPKYSFDRTIFYLFNPKQVNIDLNRLCDSNKQTVQMVQTDCVDGTNKLCGSYTETTSKISSNNPKPQNGDLNDQKDSGHSKKAEASKPAKTNGQKTPAREILEQKFEEFWKAFPSGRKVAKRKAQGIYIKIISGKNKTLKASHEELMVAIRRYAATQRGNEKYTLMPTSWLNQARWEDDPAPTRSNRDEHGRFVF